MFKLGSKDDVFGRFSRMSHGEVQELKSDWIAGARHFTTKVQEALDQIEAVDALILWRTANNVHPRAPAMASSWHMPALMWNMQPQANSLINLINCATRELVKGLQVPQPCHFLACSGSLAFSCTVWAA